MRAEDTLRVLIIEDHPVVRYGLVSLIDSQDDMAVVADVGTGREGVEAYCRLLPTLTIADLRLPDIPGVEVITRIRNRDPLAHIVVLTTYDGDEDIHQALQAGASGYMVKAMPYEDLLAAVRKVAAGGMSIPAELRTKLTNRSPVCELTSRERDILQLITLGMSNKEIAEKTGITEGTVKCHVVVILGKLGVSHRTQAAAIALRRGLAHL